MNHFDRKLNAKSHLNYHRVVLFLTLYHTTYLCQFENNLKCNLWFTKMVWVLLQGR